MSCENEAVVTVVLPQGEPQGLAQGDLIVWQQEPVAVEQHPVLISTAPQSSTTHDTCTTLYMFVSFSPKTLCVVSAAPRSGTEASNLFVQLCDLSHLLSGSTPAPGGG